MAKKKLNNTKKNQKFLRRKKDRGYYTKQGKTRARKEKEEHRIGGQNRGESPEKKRRASGKEDWSGYQGAT